MYITEATPPPRRWGRYIVALIVGYALLCLGGVYADARFLSYFDVSYWNHLAPIDFLTGFVSFFQVALTPSFLLAFILVVLLLTVVGIGLFSLVKAMRTGDQPVRLFRRPVAPPDEVLPLPEEPEETPLWTRARAIYAQPYAALAIVAVAAFVGLHVAVAAEERDLVEFAGDFRSDRADPTNYEVVSVGRVDPAETWGHMVNLRSSDNYEFYYNLVDDEPVVLSRDSIASVVASTARPEPEVQTATLDTAKDEQAHAGGAPDRSAATENAQPDSPSAGMSGIDLTVHRSIAAQAAGSGTDGDAETMPADAQADVSMQLAQAKLQLAQAATPPQPGDLAGAASEDAEEELATIESAVSRSQENIKGLRAYLQQVEGGFIKIREFVDDLDAALGGIDQAFTDLEETLAKSGQVFAYANCPEVALGQPIQFDADQAALPLEAVGLLFQARRDLGSERTADQGQWLVIEGYDDPGTGGGPSLATQRADTVRRFLQDELGVSPTVLKVVAQGAAPEGAGHVRIFDCLERETAASLPVPPPPRDVQLIRTADAKEVEGDEQNEQPIRPAAFQPEQDPLPTDRATALATQGRLAALLAELDAREDERGLAFNIPGLFASDSHRITPPAYPVLDKVGEVLVAHPARGAVIIGHTDDVGEARYNRMLSALRAAEVRDYLVDQFGVDPERIITEGRGEDEPIVSNESYQGRLANRRIEVVLVD